MFLLALETDVGHVLNGPVDVISSWTGQGSVCLPHFAPLGNTWLKIPLAFLQGRDLLSNNLMFLAGSISRKPAAGVCPASLTLYPKGNC